MAVDVGPGGLGRYVTGILVHAFQSLCVPACLL